MYLAGENAQSLEARIKAKFYVYGCFSQVNVCIYVRHLSAQCLWRSEEGTRFSEVGCGLPCACWELNPAS